MLGYFSTVVVLIRILAASRFKQTDGIPSEKTQALALSSEASYLTATSSSSAAYFGAPGTEDIPQESGAQEESVRGGGCGGIKGEAWSRLRRLLSIP